MAVPFSNTKLRVPNGFQNLLEGLAREVLRSQPENIYQFAAQYFDSLLRVREEEGLDPAEFGAKLQDRYYNNRAFQENIGDTSDPKQQEAATKIQAEVRGHQARKEVDQMKKEEETKQEEEEIDIDLNDPEVEKAAVKIQAGFKGLQARKSVKEMKSEQSGTGEEGLVEETTEEKPTETEASTQEATTEETKGEEKAADEQQTTEQAAAGEEQTETKVEEEKKAEEEEEVDIDLTDPEVEKAAVKIQAGFKGHIARKQVKEKKEAGAAEEKTEEPAGVEETDGKAAEGEEEEIDIDLNDPEVEKAAVKIQAGFKGLKARKSVKEMKEQSGEKTEETEAAIEEVPAEQEKEGEQQQEEQQPEAEQKEEGEQQKEEEPAAPAEEVAVEEKKEGEEEIDIDLNDPEVEKAAVKIQAGFKGLQARKQVKEMKGAGAEAETTEEKTEEAVVEETQPKADEAEKPAEEAAAEAETTETKEEEGAAVVSEDAAPTDAPATEDVAATDAPAEDAAPAEAPAEEVPPAEDAAPAGDAAPAEDAAPADDAAPAEDAAPPAEPATAEAEETKEKSEDDGGAKDEPTEAETTESKEMDDERAAKIFGVLNRFKTFKKPKRSTKTKGGLSKHMVEKLKTWATKAKELAEENTTGSNFVHGMFTTISTTYENEAESDNDSDVEEEYLDMFSTGFMGMFTILLSKDFLYPAFKVLHDSYPEWLAENKEKLPAEDYEKYRRQQEALGKVVAVYEQDDDTTDPEERTMDLLELLEGLEGNGEPPAELQSKQSAVDTNLQLVNKTLPQDVQKEQCSIL
ncbi:uncharacterized protein LOC144440474 isoform X15 [Glandiceps talaboti]